jgi:hypothetical protein
MSTHYFTMRNSSYLSFQDKELNVINSERIPHYDKTFFNKITGEKFNTNEVKMMRYRRNQMLTDFYQEFKESKYTWLEIGLDFKTTTRVADVLLKLNRNLKKINLKSLAYVWLVDKGETNGNMHWHLLVCVDRIELKGNKLPKELKLSFKERKVHSSFVSNKNLMIRYLKKKPIFYIGKRKRVYGKSREKKQIGTI